MYNVEKLLAALDSVIQSADGRLTVDERLLLEEIRQMITDQRNQAEIEKYFIALINFFLMVKEYLER